jgi:hypothetical protein
MEKEHKRQLFIRKIVLFLFLLSGTSASYFHVKKVEAAIIGLELLNNLSSQNDSQTTSAYRWPVNEVQKRVVFTIEGNETVDLGQIVLVGTKKKAVVVIPEAMLNQVSVGNEQANFNGNILLEKNNMPVFTTLITTVSGAVGTLLDGVTNLLKGKVLGLITLSDVVSVNTGDLSAKLKELTDLSALNDVAFSENVTLTADGTAVVVELDNGLAMKLQDTVNQLLDELKAIELKISLLPGAENLPLIGEILKIVNGTLTTSVKALEATLDSTITLAQNTFNSTESLLKQLADGSVLADSTIDIPTEISRPRHVNADLDAAFIGTIVQANVIDVNLLSQSQSKNYIYFAREIFEWQLSLPTNLDFGTHPIQTKAAETWVAENENQVTTGQISVTDYRLKTIETSSKWELSVKQESAWLNGEYPLPNAQLQMNIGEITRVQFQPEDISYPQGENIFLYNQEAVSLLSLENAQASGAVTIDLSSFYLYIPENTPKYTGTYQTTLVWTLSDVP